MSDKKTDPMATKIEALEAELEKAQLETESAKEAQMRALADLQNFQRRESGEKLKWSHLAQAELIRKILPSFLELSRGAEHADETMKAVIQKLFESLSKQGLNQILPEPGAEVDPERHEVLMAEVSETPGIVRCLEPGWSYNEAVIVPAKVSATTN